MVDYQFKKNHNKPVQAKGQMDKKDKAKTESICESAKRRFINASKKGSKRVSMPDTCITYRHSKTDIILDTGQYNI